MCPKHYQRQRRNGSPLETKTRGPSSRKVLVPEANQCKLPDCYEWAAARGLCAKHYNRLRRHGDVNAIHDAGRPRVLFGGSDLCKVELCPNLARRQGFCLKHLREFIYCMKPGCMAKHLPNREYCSLHNEDYTCIFQDHIDHVECGNLQYIGPYCKKHYRIANRQAEIMDEMRIEPHRKRVGGRKF